MFSPIQNSRPTSCFNHPPTERLPRALSLRVKRQECEAGHALPLLVKLRISGAKTTLPHMPSWRSQGQNLLYPTQLCYCRNRVSSCHITICSPTRYTTFVMVEYLFTICLTARHVSDLQVHPQEHLQTVCCWFGMC